LLSLENYSMSFAKIIDALTTLKNRLIFRHKEMEDALETKNFTKYKIYESLVPQTKIEVENILDLILDSKE